MDLIGMLGRNPVFLPAASCFDAAYSFKGRTCEQKNCGNKKKRSVVWLVVLTHPKNISQIGSFPQVGVKIRNI